MHHEKAHFVNKFFNFLLESIRNSERKVLQKCFLVEGCGNDNFHE